MLHVAPSSLNAEVRDTRLTGLKIVGGGSGFADWVRAAVARCAFFLTPRHQDAKPPRGDQFLAQINTLFVEAVPFGDGFVQVMQRTSAKGACNDTLAWLSAMSITSGCLGAPCAPCNALGPRMDSHAIQLRHHQLVVRTCWFYPDVLSDRLAPMVKRVVRTRNLRDESPRDDLAYWLSRTAEDRIEAVEILRRQYNGSTARLQRSARVVQRA